MFSAVVEELCETWTLNTTNLEEKIPMWSVVPLSEHIRCYLPDFSRVQSPIKNPRSGCQSAQCVTKSGRQWRQLGAIAPGTM